MNTEIFSYFTKEKQQITFCLATNKSFDNQLIGTLGINLGQASIYIPINGIEGAENLSNLLIGMAEKISNESKKFQESTLEKVS